MTQTPLRLSARGRRVLTLLLLLAMGLLLTGAFAFGQAKQCAAVTADGASPAWLTDRECR